MIWSAKRRAWYVEKYCLSITVMLIISSLNSCILHTYRPEATYNKWGLLLTITYIDILRVIHVLHWEIDWTVYKYTKMRTLWICLTMMSYYEIDINDLLITYCCTEMVRRSSFKRAWKWNLNLETYPIAASKLRRWKWFVQRCSCRRLIWQC